MVLVSTEIEARGSFQTLWIAHSETKPGCRPPVDRPGKKLNTCGSMFDAGSRVLCPHAAEAARPSLNRTVHQAS